MDTDEVEGLSFRVTREGRPIEGSYLLLAFVMGLKNDITMVVGPTREEGTLFVSSDEIDARFATTSDMFPMDYRPDTWTRKVEARVMTAGDVRRFVSAADIWGADLYPPGQVEGVRGWAARLPQDAEAFVLDAEVIGGTELAVEVRPVTSIEENLDRLRWQGRSQER